MSLRETELLPVKFSAVSDSRYEAMTEQQCFMVLRGQQIIPCPETDAN